MCHVRLTFVTSAISCFPKSTSYQNCLIVLGEKIRAGFVVFVRYNVRIQAAHRLQSQCCFQYMRVISKTG